VNQLAPPQTGGRSKLESKSIAVVLFQFGSDGQPAQPLGEWRPREADESRFAFHDSVMAAVSRSDQDIG
jgi:hypothetical protein